MKEQVSILSHHLGLQGSNLNILDLNHYLQDEYFVKFYTIDMKDLYKVTRESKRYHTFDELCLLEEYKPNEEETVFTDFKTLIKLFNLNIDIQCKKLYVIDNNELSYHLNDDKTAKFYHENLNINRLIKNHNYKEILFLFPQCNEEKFKEKYPEIPYEIYYKKINPELLEQIPTKKINKLYYRFDDIDIETKIKEKYGSELKTFSEYDELDLWDYKGMIYYRRKHLNYFEQLGRLVFEFILLGKEVHFLNDPFEVKDGLSDYLKFYNIKFDNKYTVITTAEELKERMQGKYDFLKGN